MYRIYAELGPRYFRPVPAQDADFFVLPFDWRYGTREGRRTEDVAMAMAARSAAQSFSERALELGKRLIVFYVGDSEEEVPLEDSVVFRTSLRRGARSNEFAMVVFFEDVVGRRLGSCLPLRPKLNSPSVGFCGFAGYRLMPGVDFVRKVRRIARWLRDGIPAPTTRERAIQLLQGHPSVLTDFILREHGVGRFAYAEPARDEFCRNLINTDYMLCARGMGNWSIRLYETFAFSRIPLFIDTECVLPFDFEIDYKKYCVWVDSGDMDVIADRLMAFHDSLSESDFIDLQRACRGFWEERLRPEGFFSNFYRHFNL